MEWTQSRAGYYADFILVPLLVLFAFITELAYHGPSRPLFAATIVGYAVWTLAEYWIHRSLFHHTMRREHWLHHKKPRGYVSAPWFLTGLIHVLLLGAFIGSLGMALGCGTFVGTEAGYLGYIIVHDRIHHGRRKSTYIRRRAALHDVHHTYGSEKNFGVVSSFWDYRFDTHQEPTQGT